MANFIMCSMWPLSTKQCEPYKIFILQEFTPSRMRGTVKQEIFANFAIFGGFTKISCREYGSMFSVLHKAEEVGL